MNSNTPSAAGRAKRLALIIEAMEESNSLAQSQQTLLQDETERQKAEDHFIAMSLKVQDDLEEVNKKINGLTLSQVELTSGLSSVPMTPTRNRIVNLPNLTPDPVSPPSTPSRRTAVAAAAVATTTAAAIVTEATTVAAASTLSPTRPVAGSTLRESEEEQFSDPVLRGSRYPAYVVYLGKGGAHGVFYAWMTYQGITGAREIYDPECHDHVIRSFSDRTLAHKFYQEFLDSDGPKILAEQEATEDEHFIVIEGVKPMVCKDRKTLIMDALQFRGGVFYRYLGTTGGAWVRFNQFKAQGQVKTLHRPRTIF